MDSHSFNRTQSAPRYWPVAVLCLCLASFIAPVAAKLPPPTPEEAAKAAAEAEKTKAEAVRQQQALTRVQDDVVARYRSDLKARGIVPWGPGSIFQRR